LKKGTFGRKCLPHTEIESNNSSFGVNPRVSLMGPYGKEDLIPRIPAENENVQKRPRFFETVCHKVVQCCYAYNEVFGPHFKDLL